MVCDLYAQANELHQQGVHLVSTDEKTGIQALERAAPDLPMKPGLKQRREFEYIRHGTQCLIVKRGNCHWQNHCSINRTDSYRSRLFGSRYAHCRI